MEFASFGSSFPLRISIIDSASRARRSAALLGGAKSLSCSGLKTLRRCPPLLPSSAALPECNRQRSVSPTAGAPHGWPALFFARHFIRWAPSAAKIHRLTELPGPFLGISFYRYWRANTERRFQARP